MKIKFGPAVDSKTGSVEETLVNLRQALDFSDEVVELSFTALDRVVYSDDIVQTFRKFKYRSIHLPVVKIVNG